MLKKVIAVAALLACQAEAATEITIYNQNLALVKKTQETTLNAGVNEVIFDEVTRPMRPESAFIYGDDIRVLEQSYDEAGLNYINMLNAYVGKEVKTVRVNPANGENIFEKATLIAVDGGSPVLKFGYGVETNFPGRVVFETLPFGLAAQPILKAKINTPAAGHKMLNLAYLTGGFSWTADYAAGVTDDKTLALTGRVSLTNNSGSDFNDVKISLMAGDVNTVAPTAGIRPLMKMASRGVAMNAMMDMAVEEAVIDTPEALNGYYLYTLPEKTALQNGQMKQVTFVNAPEVSYKKEGVLTSSLSFGTFKGVFKNVHPKIVYRFYNNKEDGLGMPLPKGKISFYETDKNGALQFVGESMTANLAAGEEAKFTIGSMFDVYANGEVKELKKAGEKTTRKNPSDRCATSETTYTYHVVYKVANKSAEPVHFILKQPFPASAKILTESVKGETGEGDEHVWKMTLSAGEEKEITADVQNVLNSRICN